ncbi:MAG: 2-dehydropantoate 2-reductase [Verrucomicrobiota bacterium]|jgi:2-dehydropantoate 2-reductase
MKIAIVGCGALGSFYGAKLSHDGRDVHFLLRTDYDVVRHRGISIRSPDGNFNARPKCARTPKEIGVVDLVIIGLKTTANDQFPTLLPPLVGRRTAVLTLQNGLGNEEQLAAYFAPAQILGGLCFVCLNRLEPGVVQHLDHGRVVLGEYNRWPEPRTHDLCTMFKRAGIPCEVTDDLARAHWEKLVWNIPFNGLGVAACAGLDAFEVGTPARRIQSCFTTDQLLGDERWSRIVRELMLEIVRAAAGMDLKIEESLVDTQIQRTRTMGAYKPSTLIDFERGQPLEMESLFLEPLRRARRAGIAAPRLETLCKILTALAADSVTKSTAGAGR